MIKDIQTDNLYKKIADLLLTARKSVVRTINYTMVYTYYEIGRMIVEDEQQGKERAEYGKQVLKELSKRLTTDFGKGFSVENLDRMRYFYQVYSQPISSTLLTKSENTDEKSSTPLRKLQNAGNEQDENTIEQKSSAKLHKDEIKEDIKATLPDTISETSSRIFNLSWSHYLKLMRIEDIAERQFYEIECFNNNWSLRELQRQFDSALYQRLALSRDKKAVKQLSEKGQIINKPEDAIKEPYILEFLGLPEAPHYSESELEQAIIGRLEKFLLELGKGFTFVGRQERITIDEKHFRIDLVFYNRLLRCFVAIDLKIGELTHQDLGQMQMYVNYYDRFVKLPEENKTVGIVLCRDKSDTLVEITLPEDNDQIFASRYKTVLPDKEELRQLLNDKDFDV